MFVHEFDLNAPFAVHDQRMCWAPEECNCRSRAYLWTFYNINPLFFDSHHLFPDRTRRFYQICPTCTEELKVLGDANLRRTLEESSSEPEKRDMYRPGWCAPGFRALGNPPPLPQHGEAFLEGGGEDSGSNTSVASTPRPEDDDHLSLADVEEAVGGDPAKGEAAVSSGDLVVMDNGRLDYLEFLDQEYRQYMQHTRRGSTNRRDDDLQTGVFIKRVARIVIPANSIPLGHILNLVIFTLALLVILYLNLPYFSPPAATQRTTKPVLVIARISSESVGWTERLKDKYHLCIYTSDAPRSSSSSSTKTTPVLETPANRAHEALPYLTFIIDNYASLSKSSKSKHSTDGNGIVFIHGSRFAWHNDHPAYDGLALLQSLNVTCLKHDYTPRGGGAIEPQAAWSNKARSMIEPWNTKVISDAELATSLMQIFGGGGINSRTHTTTTTTSPRHHRTKLSRSDILRSQCCAQFAVARANILQHSRDEYVALRQWLLDDPRVSPAAAHPDDRVAGRVMSYVWHLLFLPRDQDGSRCDDGLYRLPPGFRVPKRYISDDDEYDYQQPDNYDYQQPVS
ncbi:hypothetical protein DV735_g710, partial [Chaetothyriales sp. CBS 134920]